jgi:hypothetical protein
MNWTAAEIHEAIERLSEGQALVARGATGQHYVARKGGRLVTFWQDWPGDGGGDQAASPITKERAYALLQRVQSEHPGAYIEHAGEGFWWLASGEVNHA